MSLADSWAFVSNAFAIFADGRFLMVTKPGPRVF